MSLFVLQGGVVLDPFAGGGVVGHVAAATGRRAVLIDQTVTMASQ